MSDLTVTDTELSALLRAVAAMGQQSLARSLLPHNVTPSEWSLLRELHAAGAVPQNRLAARLGMTAGAISKLVDRLVIKRLLVRGRGGGGDRRVHVIGLTGMGARLVPALANAAADAESSTLAALGKRDRAVLHTTLRKLSGATIAA